MLSKYCGKEMSNIINIERVGLESLNVTEKLYWRVSCTYDETVAKLIDNNGNDVFAITSIYDIEDVVDYILNCSYIVNLDSMPDIEFYVLEDGIDITDGIISMVPSRYDHMDIDSIWVTI